MPTPTFGDVAYRIAARQHGIVTRRQLLAEGVTDACLSHRGAGVLWEVLERSPRPPLIDITLRGSERRRPGIRAHRIGTLRDDEVTDQRGSAVTTLARTLFDLASALRPMALESLGPRSARAGPVAVSEPASVGA